MKLRLVQALLLGFLLAVSAAPADAQVLRVPGDVGDLQQAIAQVPDGGVIELAAGLYVAPPNAFRIDNRAKSFTVRAAAGANVVLSGEGTHPILRFENSNPGRGRRVFFRGLTFRDGFSDQGKVGGAVTLLAADAVFIDCTFVDNRASAPTTGGGAVLIHDNSTAVFVDSTFTGNAATNRAGAIEIFESTVYLYGAELTGNRVNLPGHRSGSPGGAMSITDSLVRIAESRFTDNQAGWVGGAIFAFGVWREPEATPATDLLITNTTFEGNRPAPDAGSPPPGFTTGGAIHVEDQATLRVFESQFLENRAEQAGAISSYRAIVEVEDSLFRGNRATGGDTVGLGGAIAITSADFADSSTDFGAVNRRPGALSAVRTLFQGRFGATGNAGHGGGCVSLGGDITRRFGDGVPQMGSLADNRARARFEEVVFFDCDVDDAPQGGGGFGGGLQVRLTDLEMVGSLVLASDTFADTGGGGGVAVFADSVARIEDTFFAGNSASRGGGLYLNGSQVDLEGGGFIANQVSPGVAVPIIQSRGAGFFAIPFIAAAQPERAADVSGVLEGALFAHNVGLPAFDVDSDTPPVNRVRYNANRFHSPTFGNLVYVNGLVARQGLSAAQLNGLVVPHSGAPAADKSDGGNTSLGAAPAAGKLLVVPRSPSRFGDPAAPEQAFAAFAWSGAGATLDGQALAERAGIRPVTAPGVHRLRVGGAEVDSDRLAAEACGSAGTLCLRSDRFLVDLGFRDFRGETALARAVPLTADTGYFFFFNPNNVEIVTKILNGLGINNHFWLFYGALSNVEYTLRALDTITGVLNPYFNPLRNFASVGDTGAFPAGAGGLGQAAEAPWIEAAATPAPMSREPALAPRQGTCQPDATSLCLNRNRFRVTLDFTDFQGNQGVARAVELTPDTGYFFFFNPDNVEVILKVLDGRPINGHFWVFFGALSNVEYTLRVTDTETGFTRPYFNPLRTFASRGDTEAIPGNP